MFTIQVQNASKRFHHEWIFKNLNLDLSAGDSIAITGGNGSGKSTLLKCLSGAIPLTSGAIQYQSGANQIVEEQWFRSLALATPYLELPEEFTLSEVLSFHFQFKNPLQQRSNAEILEVLGLEKHKSKTLSQFSSGMKQRVKLALAIFSEVPLLLLDEPTTNLDKQGVTWYLDLIQQFTQDRIVMICSNDPREYDFCEKKIALEDFK
ncbi:MAG: ABC transporter ATP-binding protein [Bacteroidetes bacterium]|nr:ABC transporter ATP-binding protein [Bacteroidota bacterium]